MQRRGEQAGSGADAARRRERVPVVFFVSAAERRLIVRALRRLDRDRARALLRVLGLRGGE